MIQGSKPSELLRNLCKFHFLEVNPENIFRSQEIVFSMMVNEIFIEQVN